MSSSGVDLIDRLLMKLRVRDDISAEEEAALRGVLGEVQTFPADHTFVRPRQHLNVSTLLLEGLMCRFKDLSEGQRQITEIHVPGDFADLHSFTLKYLDHGLMTLTPCKFAFSEHEKLKKLTAEYPHLARMLWFSTNLDAAIHREWEVSLGRRTALERTAHLFCELQVRLGTVGLASEREYALAITQLELAECLGLTSVHVNRVLKELRERKLVEFRSSKVQIFDLPELRRLAEFDPAYLYLDKQPR
ncbi:Crp/Fnr family transcriptional regulator [Sphingomonas sp. M1-B02]|uniref:Crp/Fnr family transcriptional regulator n=1 Tax=Sphingomonas sp. M1-B02 TaxID=3114300 RepID=UPI0022406EBB|nr:Crp/Fnr family transcriptional regulator [Sphingomonas sp. S6-11]UZK66431.1 Crp/Fnr family transcriptional regulator [Sphingomonas sp. S6-11]